MADTVRVDDAPTQQDFKARLDNFTSPPDTRLVASPQPLEDGSLAVVATLLTGPGILPQEEMPSAAGPGLTVPFVRQTTGGEDLSPYLVGVQEGLEHSLVAERQRLVNLTETADAGLPQPVVVNLPLPLPAPQTPPEALTPHAEAARQPPLDPLQTRADTAPKESLSPPSQLPAGVVGVDQDTLPILALSDAEGEQFVSTPAAGAPLLPPDATLPDAGPANEEAATARPASGLLIAAVFSAGLTYYWWTDGLVGMGNFRRANSRSRPQWAERNVR